MSDPKVKASGSSKVRRVSEDRAEWSARRPSIEEAAKYVVEMHEDVLRELAKH